MTSLLLVAVAMALRAKGRVTSEEEGGCQGLQFQSVACHLHMSFVVNFVILVAATSRKKKIQIFYYC